MQKIVATFFVVLLTFRLAYGDGFGNTDYFGIWNTLYKASAQKSSTDTNVVVVGGSWHSDHYKALIASYLTTSGLVDNLFVGNTTSGTVGKQLYDFAGAGRDNFCSAVTYAYDGFIAGCRSMKANGYYDIYLIKFNNNGILDTAFSTSGIKATGLGGGPSHALVRGILFDDGNGNVGENGAVTITGALGTYAGGVFHPFTASYSQKTGIQFGSTATYTAIDGTGVALTMDSTAPDGGYYLASTDTAANHHFYVYNLNPDLTSTAVGWGAPVDFTKAIGDAAADSIPSSIMVNGTNIITLGGNRVDTTAAWRCAAVAHDATSGELNTTFGKVPSPLVAGVNSSGISLFALNTARDCIINGGVGPPSGNKILPVGTIYNGSNYDFLVAKLSNIGLLDTSFSTDGIVIQSSGAADDILSSAIYLDGSNNNIYGVGRSQFSNQVAGGALAQFTTTLGAYTNNVVLNVEAVHANSTITPNVSGTCSNTTWYDLASSPNNGTLTNYASCGSTTGWNGSGTGSDPYRLTFDGSDDHVIGTNSLDIAANDITIETWQKFSSFAGGMENPRVIEIQDASYSAQVLRDNASQYWMTKHSNYEGALDATKWAIPEVGYWYHTVSVLKSSNSTSLFYLNGKSQSGTSCNNCVGTGNQASKYYIGRRSDGNGTTNFSGSLGRTTVYNRALSSAEAKAHFDSQADSYRSTPVGNIIQNGLILNFDAANAKQGISAYANGCAAGDLSWFDLSSSFLPGTLTGFASCGSTTGWNGDGTTTISGANGPYRLTFDGSSDYVGIPYNAGLNVSAVTLAAWVNTTNTGRGDILTRFANAAGYPGYGLVMKPGYGCGSTAGQMAIWVGDDTSKYTCTSGSYNDGSWHYVVATYDGTNAKMNIDGTEVVSAARTNGLSNTTTDLMIAGNSGTGGPDFAGSLATATIYSRALSPAEIRQNCNALKSRFSGATCN